MAILRSCGRYGDTPLHDDMVLGHVGEKSVAEAWNSEKMQQIRALHMTGLLDACRGCLSRQSCEENFFGVKEALMQSCYKI